MLFKEKLQFYITKNKNRRKIEQKEIKGPTCIGNAAIWRTWIASAVAISVSVLIFSVKPRRVPVSFLRLGRKDFADFFVRQMAL